jgi:uncharacterized membrane protein
LWISFSNPNVTGVFGQAFFEKGCATTVAPVDHADYVVAGVFAQAFFQKAWFRT